MLGFHEKRRLARLLSSKGTMLLLFVLIGGGVYAAVNAYYVQERATHKRTELEQELRQLETRALDLEHDIPYLEDPRGIEAELRRRYDVAKEGEEVIVLLEEEREEPGVPTTAPEPTRTFWSRLGTWFR